MDVDAVERADAVAPLLGERLPAASDEVVARAARVVGADLEARREDQAVDLDLAAADHDTGLGDPLDAAALRVDQRDVRAIEGLEVLVVEARALAELPVPRLQRLRGGRIHNNRGHARADLLHLLEVGQLHRARDRFGREVRLVVREHHREQLADDVRPAVVHQVFLLVATGRQDLEVVHTLLVPARRKGPRPLRIGRAIGPYVDRRRRALQHIQLSGVRAEMGDALHRRRACADDRDALVREPR